jgi:hypothetical protein
MAGDDLATVLKVYAGDFERAKRRDTIREELAHGTSISLA